MLELVVGFEGESPLVVSLLTSARRAACGGDRPVLITGEIGSGKSHLARYVHRHSPRAGNSLVLVDCGALPDLDNSLFGHRAGSFTGANRDLGGRLKQAHKGAVVLEDVERLSDRHQDQLHRVLVDGCYYPVGSDRELQVDVRFLATTNKPVRDEIASGRLKSDFVSRLNYFELHVPSLRERSEDIPTLCMDLLRRNLEELLRRGHSISASLHFDEDCWPAIQAREFEDNVRGLDKLVVRLIAQVGQRATITPADIEAVHPAPHRAGTGTRLWFEESAPLRAVREAAEERYILEVCRRTQFNLRRVARILDISPKSLYVKLHRYGIQRPAG